MFKDVLAELKGKIEGVQAIAVVSLDGLSVEQIKEKVEQNLDAVIAEFTVWLKRNIQSESNHGLGKPREFMVVTDLATILFHSVTAEYFLMVLLRPGAVTGKARYEMKKASWKLEEEIR